MYEKGVQSIGGLQEVYVPATEEDQQEINYSEAVAFAKGWLTSSIGWLKKKNCYLANFLKMPTVKRMAGQKWDKSKYNFHSRQALLFDPVIL